MTGLDFVFHKENQMEEMSIVIVKKIVLDLPYTDEIKFRNILTF